MRWSEISFKPPIQTLRRFGLAGGFLLTALAVWQFCLDRYLLSAALLASACVILVLAWLYPIALRPVFVGLTVLAFPINWVLTHVMLAVIFYCLFTPVALFFKLLGRDILGRRFDRAQETYWADKPHAPDVHSYFRES